MFIVFLIVAGYVEELFRAAHPRAAAELLAGFAVFYLIVRYIDTKEA